MNFKRATCLGILLLSVTWLRALDVQYGTLFTVRGIAQERGRPVLPVTRGKYNNVRVLDKATYQFLKTCSPVCVQNDVKGEIEVVHLRAAKTRQNMWIGDVSVDQKWLLTFLIFKQENKFSFIAPSALDIADKRWLSQVQAALQTHIEQGK